MQSEENLSQEGTCWIYDEAKVYDRSKVLDNAIITDLANVFDDSIVRKNAIVLDYNHVYKKAVVEHRVTCLSGLTYHVFIYDATSMAIGCAFYSINKWKEFTEQEIRDMYGENAAYMYSQYRHLILELLSLKC